MKAWLRGLHTAEWLPTLAVLAVILGAGSRLIYLSVQYHAVEARAAAVKAAGTSAGLIERQLQVLADVAAHRVAAPPGIHTYRVTADDTVELAQGASRAAAGAIAGEWPSPGAPPVSSVLGPLRVGSQWLIAERSPAASGDAWTVAYADLTELFSTSTLSRLRAEDYHFELAEFEPRGNHLRVLLSSVSQVLDDAVTARVHLPAQAAVPQGSLQLSIRPRAGWYPATLLLAEIALLGFLAWLFAFAMHDMGHALRRSGELLSTARRRLHDSNQQLAAEMQERLSLQETFDHARFHDTFTGLPNRRFFMDRLDRALKDVRTQRRQNIAVMLIDIARFKLINDMLGHTAGDELMVQAARRFEKSAANFDGILARWSGDQFSVLLLDVASEEAALLAASALREEIRTPIDLRRHRLMVSAAVGVTYVNSGQRRAEDVVREADLALSVAKGHRTSKIVSYAPSMAAQSASLVSLEADLHVAMEKHEMRLLFQPIVDLRTHLMVGAEALLRWRHPIEGLLGPDRFLSIAEDAGLMAPLTRWVILRAIRIAGQWHRRLPPQLHFFITVNLSASALRDPGLCDFVAAMLREAELAPALLKFELTEASLISNVAAARETLEQLHAMGVQLMLDDFGTGYSSLNYLQLFPFDYVKIDRPFANRMGSDQANTGMMAAMVQMATSLHLTAIAEIVETGAAATALEKMGCAFGQGFYFSEPIDAELALQRILSQEPFEATRPSEETMMLPALEDESSQTLAIPIDSIRFPGEPTPN